MTFLSSCRWCACYVHYNHCIVRSIVMFSFAITVTFIVSSWYAWLHMCTACQRTHARRPGNSISSLIKCGRRFGIESDHAFTTIGDLDEIWTCSIYSNMLVTWAPMSTSPKRCLDTRPAFPTQVQLVTSDTIVWLKAARGSSAHCRHTASLASMRPAPQPHSLLNYRLTSSLSHSHRIHHNSDSDYADELQQPLYRLASTVPAEEISGIT